MERTAAVLDRGSVDLGNPPDAVVFRGVSVENVPNSPVLAKVRAHTVSAAEIVREYFPSSVGVFWAQGPEWDVYAAMDQAESVVRGAWLDEYYDEDYGADGCGFGVVFIAKAPQGFAMKDWDWTYGERPSGVSLNLIEVWYNTGDGWRLAPGAQGVRVTSVKEAGANGDLPEGISFMRMTPEQVRAVGFFEGVEMPAEGVQPVGIDGAAWLLWAGDGHPRHAPGTILNVYVSQDYRRRGIAAAMLEQARRIDPRVHHSDILTNDGAAWSQRVAMPSWRDRGVLPSADAVIAPDVMGRRRLFEVLLYGERVARETSLAAAKQFVEIIYGPLQWSRIKGDQDKHFDGVWGMTTEFNDASVYYVVERLPRLAPNVAQRLAAGLSQSGGVPYSRLHGQDSAAPAPRGAERGPGGRGPGGLGRGASVAEQRRDDAGGRPGGVGVATASGPVSVFVTPAAVKDYRALTPSDRTMVNRAVRALKRREGQIKPLKGNLRNLYRVAVGDSLRVVYVDHGDWLEIVLVGTHEGIYKRVERRMGAAKAAARRQAPVRKEAVRVEVIRATQRETKPAREATDDEAFRRMLTRSTHAVVAWDNDRVVGVIEVAPGDGAVGNVHVAASHRGRGVGTQMLSAAAKAVLDAGRREMSVYNVIDSARSWYIRNGAYMRPGSGVATWIESHLRALADGRPVPGHADASWNGAVQSYVDSSGQKVASLRLTFERGLGTGYREIVAYLDGVRVGSLHWEFDTDASGQPLPWKPRDFDPGRIGYVEVAPEYRRQGVATALLEAARQWDPSVHHSDNLTPDGRAWAERVATIQAKVAAADFEDGVMVALIPPLEVSRVLVEDDLATEPLEGQHITLVYLGKTADVDHDLLHKAIEEWAQGTEPLVGWVAGYGVFTNPGENVLWAGWTFPKGAGWRQGLVDALGAVGIVSPSQYGWTPHQTLAYEESPVTSIPLLPDGLPEEVVFGSVVVAYGGQWTTYSLDLSPLAP